MAQVPIPDSERKRDELTAPCPWASFASSQSRASRLGSRGPEPEGYEAGLRMLVRHSGQKVAPSVRGSSGIRAGKGSWACRWVAAPVGALEPRHPELPGAGALQPIQPGHALPPAERSDSNTEGWLWPRKSPPARDQRTRRGGGASAPEFCTLANPNEGGRACRIHAAAAGGGKGPHNGKVAGRLAFRAAP